MSVTPQRLRQILLEDARSLPPTQVDDWRARHSNEIPQTFAMISKPGNRGIHGNSSITLYATTEILTDFPGLVECLKAFLGSYFQVPVSALRALSIDDLKLNDRRGQQVRTTALLQQVGAQCDKSEKRLILTSYDLFPNENRYKFVFGEADYLESKAVVSLFRYDLQPHSPLCGISLTRVLKVTSHEIGHLFALEHCLSHPCNMNGKNHTDELDLHPLELCGDCVAKWVWFSSPDVRKRFVDLQTFYGKYNLLAEQGCVSRRITLLNHAA